MPDNTNPFGPTPPGVFADMPTLREIVLPAGVPNEPFPTAEAFYTACDKLPALIARGREQLDDAASAGETLTQIANLHATLTAGMLPPHETGPAHRVLAAIVHGETVGDLLDTPSGVIRDRDRFTAWADGRGPLIWQQVTAAITEIDRVRSLPIAERDIDGATDVFSDAPGLRPLDISHYEGDFLPQPIYSEDARRQVFALTRSGLSAEERSNLSRWLLMRIETSHYDGHFGLDGRPVWSAADVARAGRVLASIAAGEGPTLGRDPNQVFDAIIDSATYEKFITVRNTPVLEQWMHRAAAESERRVAQDAVLSARWSDPVADMVAVIAKATFANYRARAFHNVGGTALFDPLPEIGDLRGPAIRTPCEFDEQLQVINRGQFFDDEDLKHTITRVLHAVREGYILTDPAEAGRAEQLLRAASDDLPLPPLVDAIRWPQVYQHWAIERQTRLEQQQHHDSPDVTTARADTYDLDPADEDPELRHARDLAEYGNEPDWDAIDARRTQILAALIDNPRRSINEIRAAMDKVGNLTPWASSAEHFVNDLIRHFQQQAGTGTAATDLTAAIAAAPGLDPAAAEAGAPAAATDPGYEREPASIDAPPF